MPLGTESIFATIAAVGRCFPLLSGTRVCQQPAPGAVPLLVALSAACDGLLERLAQNI